MLELINQASLTSKDLQSLNNFDPIVSNDARAALYSPPSPEMCEYCGAALYVKGMYFKGNVRWFNHMPCACDKGVEKAREDERRRQEQEQAAKDAERQRLLRKRTVKLISDSGMRKRFLQRTFSTFEETSDNAKALRVALDFAENFDNISEKPRNGLYFIGAPGVGKTHLAAAIANHLLSQQKSVICMPMIDMLNRIKATFRAWDVSEEQVLALYDQVSLLVIDDIGKETPTDWAISTMYGIINRRYENCMPTIITTNYDRAELVRRLTPRDTKDGKTADATIDRLMEICIAVPMMGKSWRAR